MMTEVKQTFLALCVFVCGCSRQPEAAPAPPVAQADTSALDFYDVSLNNDTVSPGSTIRFCFKAKNAISVFGFPGKFQNNGALDGDCLVHAPQVDTMYRLEVRGADGSRRTQSAFVKVRKTLQ